MSGLNKGRQTHIEVPSSNEPKPTEWGKPTWYVIRLAALQAHEGLSDEKAKQLVGFFESLHVVIPCPECRGHFTEYYALHPFTLEFAKNTNAAMWWVEEYRRNVDMRIAQERKAKGESLTRPHVEAPTPLPASSGTELRQFAVKSAVLTSKMNHTGRKIGCNCGGKRGKRY